MRQSEGKPGSNDSSVRPLLRPSPPSSLPLPLHPSLLLSIPPHPSLLLHSGPPCGAGRGRTTASGPCAWHRAPSTKLQALSTTTAALSAAENNPQRCTHTSDTHGARTHPPRCSGAHQTTLVHTHPCTHPTRGTRSHTPGDTRLHGCPHPHYPHRAFAVLEFPSMAACNLCAGREQTLYPKL